MTRAASSTPRAICATGGPTTIARNSSSAAKCVVDQYSGYTIIDDIKINGKLTNGEDIADLGGTLLAYLAWKEDTKAAEARGIDGLTPEQRFFVGYAQSWCSNEKDETKRLRATVDPHSPEKYRANGVVVKHAASSAKRSTANRGNRWCARTPAGCGSAGTLPACLEGGHSCPPPLL